MSDKMMRICGKTDTDTAKAIHVNDSGNVVNNHVWEITAPRIYDETPSDTNKYTVGFDPLIPLYEYGIISLRVRNKTGVPVKIEFISDSTDAATGQLQDVNGDIVGITIPSNDYDTIITPQDIPALSYLRVLKLYIQCMSAPNGGVFRVWLEAKR